MGEEEEVIIQRLSNVLETVIEHENHARLKLIEDDCARMFDKIGRAFGLAEWASFSSKEAMNSLSLVKLGLDLGLLPAEHASFWIVCLLKSAKPHSIDWSHYFTR